MNVYQNKKCAKFYYDCNHHLILIGNILLNSNLSYFYLLCVLIELLKSFSQQAKRYEKLGFRSMTSGITNMQTIKTTNSSINSLLLSKISRVKWKRDVSVTDKIRRRTPRYHNDD